MNVDLWLTGTLNKLSMKVSYTQIKFSKEKDKVASGKIALFMIGHFVHYVFPILFFLKIVGFARVVLFKSVAFSTVALSTKKRYSIFLRKFFVFQKNCFRGKVMKTFKISSDSFITNMWIS